LGPPIQDINFLLNEVDALTERNKEMKLLHYESESVLAAAKEEIGRLEKENAELRKHAEALSRIVACLYLKPGEEKIWNAYQRFRDGGVGK
jgi:hypothetical protein